MAISSIDDLINGFLVPQEIYKISGSSSTVGRFNSLLQISGRPGAGNNPTGGTAGVALTSLSGQIPFPSSVTGSNIYIGKISANATIAGTMLVCDRLWHNSGISVTSTSTQSVDSATFPARDLNGTTNGEGVMIGIEVYSAMGAGTPTITMTYLDSNGATSSIVSSALPTTMAAGNFIQMPLAAGDTGVRKVIDWKQSATMTSGLYSIVAYRVIARLDIPTASVGAGVDAIQLGLPRMYDNSVPFILWLPSTNGGNPNLQGQIIFAQG